MGAVHVVMEAAPLQERPAVARRCAVLQSCLAQVRGILDPVRWPLYCLGYWVTFVSVFLSTSDNLRCSQAVNSDVRIIAGTSFVFFVVGTLSLGSEFVNGYCPKLVHLVSWIFMFWAISIRLQCKKKLKFEKLKN